MNNKYILALVALATLSQIASAAIMTIHNKTSNTVEATVRYGSAQTPKVVEIPRGSKEQINSGIHEFKSISWHPTNSGVYSAALIPFTRTMLNGGMILIDPKGYNVQGASTIFDYFINFNANGVYPSGTVEGGQSGKSRNPKPVLFAPSILQSIPA
jgi:hypothetical protein